MDQTGNDEKHISNLAVPASLSGCVDGFWAVVNHYCYSGLDLPRIVTYIGKRNFWNTVFKVDIVALYIASQTLVSVIIILTFYHNQAQMELKVF